MRYDVRKVHPNVLILRDFLLARDLPIGSPEGLSGLPTVRATLAIAEAIPEAAALALPVWHRLHAKLQGKRAYVRDTHFAALHQGLLLGVAPNAVCTSIRGPAVQVAAPVLVVAEGLRWLWSNPGPARLRLGLQSSIRLETPPATIPTGWTLMPFVTHWLLVN